MRKGARVPLLFFGCNYPLPNRYFLNNGLMRRMLLVMMQKAMTISAMRTDRVVSMAKLCLFSLKNAPTAGRSGRKRKCRR